MEDLTLVLDECAKYVAEGEGKTDPKLERSGGGGGVACACALFRQYTLVIFYGLYVYFTKPCAHVASYPLFVCL